MDSNKKFSSNLDYLDTARISIIGLGYVGLPLAFQFDQKIYDKKNNKKLSRKVVGFDINQKRIIELKNGFDKTNEINLNLFGKINSLIFTSKESDLIDTDVFIISVPTPIDKYKNPDLDPLKSASALVAKCLKKRNQLKKRVRPIIIYESTVFPGCTEEICIPIVESISNLKLNEDFFCGYSPERINPGDSEKKINKIVKITSGSCEQASLIVDFLYSSIIDAGTFMAHSIKVAEAAKIIENTQRDINIALVNELAVIFNKLGIDTKHVLDAANTKWNFIDFKPGLVGGHCIGVDPYYLAYKAKQLNYKPEILLSGRRINDQMSNYIVEQFLLNLIRKKIDFKNNKILILGITFKENCPDYRNSLVINILKTLLNYDLKVTVVDPYVDIEEIYNEYQIAVEKEIKIQKYSGILVCVAHDIFKEFSNEYWQSIIKDDSVIYDVKGIVPLMENTVRL